jgi:DNA repair protein RecO (recombination protein O)
MSGGGAGVMDLKTRALVLRRVDYGEADRIVDLLTPHGKVAVIAKGVRREKSRMAGGIELFSLSEVVVRRKRAEGLGILSSVRLVEFYGTGIMTDLGRLELAGEVLREVGKLVEGVEGGEFFDLTQQVLEALGDGVVPEVARAWWRLNLLRASGEGVNLWRDVAGTKLAAGERYTWDEGERGLRVAPGGTIGTDEIKVMRLMVSGRLAVVRRLREAAEVWPVVERVTRG